VSSYSPTKDITGYAQAIRTSLQRSGYSNPRFVVDTARNGAADWRDDWCNPPGRALGQRPGVKTASPLADAYLWIKLPGESDGACKGGPSSGSWWPEYALGLAERARW